MAVGFITLHRKIKDNPIWQSPLLLKLFINLLFEANYESSKYFFDGQEITIERGQLITGRFKLATQTGINPNTIKDLLTSLVKRGLITTKSTNKFSLITIVKYNDYQNKSTRSTNKTPTKHQPDTNKTPQSNKCNNGNKETIDATATLFDKFKSNPLWGELIKKYPDRDYKYQFNLMLDWWRARKKKDPQAISAFENWLKNTQPDENLKADRLHREALEENERKQKELDAIPLPKKESLDKLQQDINKLHQNFKTI